MGGLFRSFPRRFSRCWRPWDAEATKDAALSSGRIDGGDRRLLLQMLSAIAVGNALATSAADPTKAQWWRRVPAMLFWAVAERPSPAGHKKG